MIRIFKFVNKSRDNVPHDGRQEQQQHPTLFLISKTHTHIYDAWVHEKRKRRRRIGPEGLDRERKPSLT